MSSEVGMKRIRPRKTVNIMTFEGRQILRGRMIWPLFALLLVALFSAAFRAEEIESMEFTREQVALQPDVWLGSIPQEKLSAISPLFTKEVQYWEKQISWWADQYGLDPDLVAMVMQIESCGHPTIVSSAGALGLFQVMPFHFEEGENPLDPNINAHRGLSYLSRALELTGGDVELALAGYNGGHGVVDWERGSWAYETLRYIYWGTGIYQDAKNGFNESPRLQQWLNEGGYSLCQRASEELSLFD